ncbi:hypothetical protein Tsubulata_008517 [Turnera subulata]|uniref:RRM domain-containing protein n=1 Tax=Turnera subulata TaxID=218843 RepID=A0A9Q0F7W6_9ROSI|nr:hypothetical protein Tsubulata_008517 [Turnera subulata]
MDSISIDQLHSYHAIDREVFSRLVLSCFRDPGESLLVMATWLWLEDKGYPKLMLNMTKLSNLLVNSLADEAALCLKSLESNTIPMLPNGGMPLTARVIGTNISVEMFHQNKFTAISGIKNFLNTTCARIFTDILQLILPCTSRSLVVPGFPHPLFGDVTIVPRSTDPYFPTGGIWGWTPSNNISEDDRTMFLTFSRGFPVTAEEVTELFTRMCGECVVRVQMQENVPSSEQPLFARMVLRSVTDVDRILNGRRIAKFRINGKHIWARKYERRE